MAKIQIEDYGIWYDDDTDLIFDEEGECRSNIPTGTFPFKGKLYTYGTKVRIGNRYHPDKYSYIATFKKDTEMKKTRFSAVPMKEAREYFDGKPFELDEIFLEDGGNKRTYLSTIGFDNGIIEIVEPVYYIFPKKEKIAQETPPELSGYRTKVNTSITDPQYIRYKDHLFNCEVDVQGNVTNWFEPNTFGYGKYVYTKGTKVIIKHRSFGKSFYYVGEFDGSCFRFNGYPLSDVGYSSGLSASAFKNQNNSKGLSIVKIIEPHYYRPVARKMNAFDKFSANGGPRPLDTSFGTFIYIIVMVGGAIFKDRWMLWIFATIIYILWRFGYMNKNK